VFHSPPGCGRDILVGAIVKPDMDILAAPDVKVVIVGVSAVVIGTGVVVNF